LNIFNSRHIVISGLVLWISLIATLNIFGQSIKLQVVTTKVEKNMKYKNGQILSVEGEKSEVNIMPWDENYISIVLTLSAQHPERAY